MAFFSIIGKFFNAVCSPSGRNGRNTQKTYIDDNGYRRFSDSGKLVSRWMAEEKLGRKLTSEEVVHHRNEDKLDNRPSNLWVFRNQDEHDKKHGYGRNDDYCDDDEVDSF